MKNPTLKIISFILLCAVCLAALGCEQRSETDGDYCRINGRNLYFWTDEEKREWKDPLEKLLEKAFVTLAEQTQSSEYKAKFSTDEAAIAAGYALGLLDVTHDGIPELLVHPFGYYGSSGAVTYFIYDIFSGQRLGEICGGNDESWCVYYDVVTDETILVGQYWYRGGWSCRDRFITTAEYDRSTLECSEVIRFQTSHAIDMKQTDADGDGSSYEVWETYPETIYYVNDKEVSLDDYYDEYGIFTKNFIRISETELIIVDWDDVSGEDDDSTAKAERMAEALVTSAQKFLKPNGRWPKTVATEENNSGNKQNQQGNSKTSNHNNMIAHSYCHSTISSFEFQIKILSSHLINYIIKNKNRNPLYQNCGLCLPKSGQKGRKGR